jgi:hypothetical protein
MDAAIFRGADYLCTTTGTLYDSMECALSNGALQDDIVAVSQEDYDNAWDEDSGHHFGALCPVCERPYNNY